MITSSSSLFQSSTKQQVVADSGNRKETDQNDYSFCLDFLSLQETRPYIVVTREGPVVHICCPADNLNGYRNGLSNKATLTFMDTMLVNSICSTIRKVSRFFKKCIDHF